MPMNDATLNHELDGLSHDATGNNETFMKENEFLMERYLGNLYGDEAEERSKVVSADVSDVVESDMTSLARVFLGPSDIMKFKPNNSKNDEDKAEAEEKTKYVNWQVREQEWSFGVLHGYIKNALINKLSVVKYYVEESTSVEEHKKTGLSDEEIAAFQQDLEKEDGVKVEISREERDGDESTIVFKVEKTRKSVKIDDVPLECFRMTKNATSKESAPLVGDVTIMKRGELLAKGFSKEQIDQIPIHGKQADNRRMRDIRNEAEGTDEDRVFNVWASEEVEIEDYYPMVDYDGDGIEERRHIMRGGSVILQNEVFNHVPYALMSSILMPHKAIGRSRAEITAPVAEIKTELVRGINDNIYAVNSPRMGVNDRVELDDLLVMRPNGIVRTKDDTNPGQNLMPIEIPYIGDKALQVVQYWDHARSQTTGSLLANQGLDSDDLGQETATRFEGVKEESQAKVELVARVMSETGFRQLYEGVAWLNENYQDTETEIEVLGKELTVNPANWRFQHKVISRVGLGAGDNEQISQTMTGLWVIHQQLREMNSPMTDEVKRYNILRDIIKAAGLPNDEDYVNNPEVPESMLLAQTEILSRVVEQLQEQVGQNPLAEAEQIKAQAKLIEAENKRELDVAKMLEDQRQFNMKMAQDNDQFQKTIATKLAELEAKYQNDFEQPAEQPAQYEFDPLTGEFGETNTG